MSSHLEKRIERLEALLGQGEKVLVIVLRKFGSPFPPLTEADLTAPPSPSGEAWISPFYSVKFQGGTRMQWEERLAELRADPRFQRSNLEEPNGTGLETTDSSASPEAV